MYKITQKNLLRLLNGLKKEGKVIAPVKMGKDIVFDYISDVNKIELNYKNVVKPPKEFFMPQCETILEFNKNRIKANLKQEKRTLFGIRPCDLMGLCAMDQTFNEKIKDPHYLEKRENTIIIAYGCTENCDENAFCDSIFGHIAKDSFDIQIIKLNKDKFFVETESSKGIEIINKNKQLFKQTNSEEARKVNSIKNKKINKASVNLDLFTEKLGEKFKDEKLWEKFSKTCIRCGACNYLCPSCSCFNMVDMSSERIRCWDSCMLRGFTREAAGVIPRETLASRFRQRIYHKYKWHKERYNVDMCTGCGRCVTYCPGLIPYTDIIKEVSNE